MASEPGTPVERPRIGPAAPERLQGLLEEVPLHRALGLKVAAVHPDGLELQAHPGAAYSIGAGQLHGGAVASILDTAATFALIATTGDDWGTVDLRVDYLRPAPVGRLEVSARVLHAGRRVGRAVAELTEPANGRVVAGAVGTFVRQAQGER